MLTRESMCAKSNTVKDSLDKAEYEKLLNRMQTFAHETETRNGLYLTMITTEGLAEGKYANNIVSQIVLDDIFAL